MLDHRRAAPGPCECRTRPRDYPQGKQRKETGPLLADRKGEHPQGHLKNFKGTLQADAYGGWTRLYDGGHVVEAACWAHARRPWWDLYLATGRAEDSLAAQALRRIRELYAIEAEIRGQCPDVRREQRHARAGPLLDNMHAWLAGLIGRVSAKSGLAQATRYSLTRWKALTRYVDDGRIEIDNNAAERALRGVALGRNNYLFMGSDVGGERAAAIYSLVETAKLNELDPEVYLREVFERIADASDQPRRRVAAVEHRAATRRTTAGGSRWSHA